VPDRSAGLLAPRLDCLRASCSTRAAPLASMSSIDSHVSRSDRSVPAPEPRSHGRARCTCHTTELASKFREGSEATGARRVCLASVRFQCSSPASRSVHMALMKYWTALRVPCCGVTAGGGRLQSTMLYLQGDDGCQACQTSDAGGEPQKATLEHIYCWNTVAAHARQVAWHQPHAPPSAADVSSFPIECVPVILLCQSCRGRALNIGFGLPPVQRSARQ
jgi:hypothetical protein